VSRPGWLVSVVAGALLLAGCSGAEPSASPPSEPPSTTPATSARTPTPPPLPASAQKPTKAGAVAFAHYYIDLVNFASRTGEPTRLLDVSAAGCESCRKIGRFIASVYQRGGFIHGGEWSARSYSVLRSGEDRWLVAVKVKAAKQTYRVEPSAPAKTRTGGVYTVSVDASWQGHRWLTRKLVSAS